MGYVRANTAPQFGMRSQALSPMASRLGYYFRSAYPLPTTSMSRPLRLGSAFWDGPDNVYPQPELSRTRAMATLQGEWVPPQPPQRALFQQGAVTYRINPQTGQYEFHTTDLLPRGVWHQNTFQHPQRSALSALGVPVGSRGVSLVQVGGRNVVMPTTPVHRGATSNEPLMKLKAALAGMFSGPGCGSSCHCGGRCKKGLGDAPPGTQMQPYGIDQAGNAVFIDNEGNVYDQDGNPLTDLSNINSSPAAVKAAGGPWSTSSKAQQVINGIQQVENALAPKPQVQTASASNSLSNWFSGSTVIAGMRVPNFVLTGGLALVGLTLASGGRRR